ncbi:ALK and LTK ligand 2 [Bagarius yarrelli]|uniref:ALK and LTK ligand 2 n=1 Tax=Bagarius yarrelli TaxID=175774 RepID=A0A556U7N8_BAGYA|nr:ALK and LTK ligand 2 [Bagarius yarrelli]
MEQIRPGSSPLGPGVRTYPFVDASSFFQRTYGQSLARQHLMPQVEAEESHGQKLTRLSGERGTLQLRFIMIVLRAPVFTALALLIVSGGYDGQSGSASARSTSLLQLLTERSGREAAEHHGNSNEHQAQSPLPIRTESREGKEVNNSNLHNQTLGPLYFSPKCSKHFYRLYNYTRDCTIPACK